MVDLIKKNCTCIQYFDRGSCKHLIACVILADKPVVKLPVHNKFNIRYRNRSKTKKDSDDEQIESQSLSNSNQSSPTVQQSYEPVINPSIVFKSPIPIASCRITRSKLSKVVELQKITKIPHKETAKQAKKDELESISVDKPKRGRPKKITKALQFDT